MRQIVAIGGTVKPDSSTELALRVAVAAAQAEGAVVDFFNGAFLLSLPHFGTPAASASSDGQRLLEAVRRADGVIIASPGYHGGVSGLTKNAVDYLEELALDQRVYLDGRTVGLIATAYGFQAATSTLANLRTIVHALRGWPTPMGAAIRCRADTFGPGGECLDENARIQLETVGRQVVTGMAER